MVIKAEASPMSLGSACSSIGVAEKDSKGMTNQRLLAASRDNDLDGMRKAVDDGAYLETRRPFVMRPKPPNSAYEASGKKRKTPKEGLTPLMYAAQNGSADAAKLLLESRAQIGARDEDGLQPLHFAASSGYSEVCDVLLAHGADKNAADESGRRAIEYVPEEQTEAKADREKWEALLGRQAELAALAARGAPAEEAAPGAGHGAGQQVQDLLSSPVIPEDVLAFVAPADAEAPPPAIVPATARAQAAACAPQLDLFSQEASAPAAPSHLDPYVAAPTGLAPLAGLPPPAACALQPDLLSADAWPAAPAPTPASAGA